jgi:hypothetical protein
LGLIAGVYHYLSQPDRVACPLPLLLARNRAEGRMLVAGGLYDQPMIWFAVNYAERAAWLIDRMGRAEFRLSDLSPVDLALYEEIIGVVGALHQN